MYNIIISQNWLTSDYSIHNNWRVPSCGDSYGMDHLDSTLRKIYIYIYLSNKHKYNNYHLINLHIYGESPVFDGKTLKNYKWQCSYFP